MNFHILTLFPEMVVNGLHTSITGRALENGKITLQAVNIRDFSKNKHKKVDDYPYGGGAGMLMQAQPVYDAYKSVADTIPTEHKKRVIYVTPQGYPFTQKMAEEFARNDDLIFLCGHYEGIDERVLEEVVTDYVSIGDYVLTGGELAAMVMIDAIARLVPGVLHNEISAEIESFHGELLEYPQYSRPESWHYRKVPQVLLSGNQKKIDAWRLEESIKRTKERRPDLYQQYERLQRCKEKLMKKKILHMDMIELINRGRAVIVLKEWDKILLKDKKTNIYYYAGDSAALLRDLDDETRYSIEEIVLHEVDLIDEVKAILGKEDALVCYQAVYTQKERMPITGLYRADGKPTAQGLVIRTLTEEDSGKINEIYDLLDDIEYTKERIVAGCMFGAFLNDEFAGCAGIHDDGSLGILKVLEKYRGRKIGSALETYVVNYALQLGWIPYAHIEVDNVISLEMQKKLGMHLSKTPIVWMA